MMCGERRRRADRTATLSVTPDAARAVRSLLDQTRKADHQVFRLLPVGDDGFRLALSRLRRTDRIACRSESEEPVLVVGRKLDAALSGLALDVQELPEGENLTLTDSGTSGNDEYAF